MIIRCFLALLLFAFLCVCGLSGCFSDEDWIEGLDGGNNIEDTETYREFSSDDAVDGGRDGGNYYIWLEADESLAPGRVISFVEEGDTDHVGYFNARCMDCHGYGNPHEPVNHDPIMQTWAWSCARGFPNTPCHGHDTNGTEPFNHDGDPDFDGCTQKECHDTLNTIKEYENHGYMKAPDTFCNACHDYYWEDWPIGDPFESK